jgi:hypothetical protein
MCRAIGWKAWKTPSRLTRTSAPFLFRAVDEGLPAAAADAGVGEAAVDAAVFLQRGGAGGSGRIGVGHIDDQRVDLAAGFGDGFLGGAVLVRIARPDRNRATGLGHRLRHAKPDAAVAAGDDRDAAGKIKEIHGLSA